MVPVGDVAGMADALDETIASPPPPERLRERAEAFRQDRIVGEYLDLWRSLPSLGTPSSNPA